MKVAKVIAPGIYQMENGSFRVVARVGDRKTGPSPKEKRFSKGASLRAMRVWQEDARAGLRRQNLRPTKGTLADDIGRYLREVGQSVKYIKDRKLKKVQAAIQADQVRVSSPSKDELQEAIRVLRDHDFGVALQFGNYR